MTKHPNYDAFKQARDIRRHLNNIKPAVMTVGGWFDAEDLFETLETYRKVEKSSPGTFNTLVMGPWYHGGWSSSDGSKLGNVQFNAKTSEHYRKEMGIPFFEYYLKDKKDPKLAEAIVFETGTKCMAKFHRLATEEHTNAELVPESGKHSISASPQTGSMYWFIKHHRLKRTPPRQGHLRQLYTFTPGKIEKIELRCLIFSILSGPGTI